MQSSTDLHSKWQKHNSLVVARLPGFVHLALLSNLEGQEFQQPVPRWLPAGGWSQPSRVWWWCYDSRIKVLIVDKELVCLHAVQATDVAKK